MLTSQNSTTTRHEMKGSSRQNYLDHSPESDQFKKYCAVLMKFNPLNHEKGISDSELIKALTQMKHLTKKTKYQLKILDMQMIQKVMIPIMYTKGNIELNIISARIFLNVAKNKNHHYKLTPEDLIMKEMLNLLIISLNSNLTSFILKILFHLTDNKEFLNKLKKQEEKEDIIHIEKEIKDLRALRKIDLSGFTRVFIEKILDDLSSNNKNLLLKTICNIYQFSTSCLHSDSIEPIMRCLGDKDNDTIISALNIILMYSKEKIYHQQLINTNFIFRLVRIYKLGIVEMDTILVQILLIFFENPALHELLFESKIVFILENYLNSFDNDQNEEVLKNVFEIFKEIIKISDQSSVIKNPIKDDDELQMTIFSKALTLASSTKKEATIFSCLTTVNMMLEQHHINLLRSDEQVKKILEQMPLFFKSKDFEILKYSLSIFEIVLVNKIDYFQENYVKSNDKTFNIKSLIHFVINLINEFFSNFAVVSKACSILILLSDINLLHNYFLQEPQITVIRVFNDDMIKEKIKLIKDLAKFSARKSKKGVTRKESDKDSYNIKKDYSKKNSFSDLDGDNGSPIRNPNYNKTDRKHKPQKEEISKKDEELKKEIEKRLLENKEILKYSINIVSNLTKYNENLETLTNKGFVDIINKLLNTHNLDALPQIVKCVQGFCGSSASINMILNYQIIYKILKLFKLYKEIPLVESSNLINIYLLKNNGNRNGIPGEEILIYERLTSKLEVLISLRNIIESDIKMQRQFVIDEGINIIFGDVMDKGSKISEKLIDQLNSMILKVLYVVSCNINKLFIVFNKGDLEIDDFIEMSKQEEKANSSFSKSNSISESESSKIDMKPSIISSTSEITVSNIEIFKKQLSQHILMDKLICIGFNEFTSLNTYKDLIKILINLYLNRYYLKYFTTESVFDKVMSIVDKILQKALKKNDNSYDIIKLILIFLKFICEEEHLIKRFLESSVVYNIFHIINNNEYSNVVDKQELGQFYYNVSLVILRLTEFKGHTAKFEFLKTLFSTFENLYDVNIMNGKIYIINILKNILNEKEDFFSEDDIIRFINKIVSQGNTLVIYEFVELLKILVFNRNLCKRMDNIFRYLIYEIKSSTYSQIFKKKMLELILCLSYENTNIKDFALPDLLALIKSLDMKINKKTTLLILMNFSSVSSNFEYLTTTYKNPSKRHTEYGGQTEDTTIKKKDLITIVNHLLDSDRFSQILIQRLLINITSIENIDLSIISVKILNVLIEIISKSQGMEESVIIFSLSVLINVSNRNMLKVELNNEDNTSNDDSILNVVDEMTEHNHSASSSNQQNRSNLFNNADPNKKEVSDICIVDYILSKLTNIIEIINDLFERNNMDIASLTIMFACNLSRKIKLSSFFLLEAKITNCIDDYFIKNFSKKILENDSGKFFVIAIIKYCTCLSGDERKVREHKRLFENIINLLLDEDKQLLMIDLTKEDIISNNIKFVLTESKIKFLNIMMELCQNSNIFEKLNLKKLIFSFYAEFIKELSALLMPHPQYKFELHSNLQELILASFHILLMLLNNNFKYESIAPYVNQLVLYLINYDPIKISENLKSLFVLSVYHIIHNLYDKENSLNNNLEFQIWLVNLFKIQSNSLQTDYYVLKIFLKSATELKNQDIYWKSSQFIKKLHGYVSKFNQEDDKSLIMKKESEKILNMISFNINSHQKMFDLGIYEFFKNNLYSKFFPGSDVRYSRDDVIFLVNLIINKENQGLIKDDLTSLLKNIFLCKDLATTAKVQIFENFVMYTLEQRVVKVFKEDYLIIFNLLYENLKENFSDMIILVDNFTRKKNYEHFCKMLVSDDTIIKNIYSDFLIFDKEFPSKFEELNSFFKILENFINNCITKTIEEIVNDIMRRIISKNNQQMGDINIINCILSFVLFYYSHVIEWDKSKSSDEEHLKFVKKYHFSEFFELIYKNAIKSKDSSKLYILTTKLFQQEDYKSILKPLNSLNNFLFGKEFMVSFLGGLVDRSNLDIREFVYIINIANNLCQFGNIECVEEFLKQIVEVYESYIKLQNYEDPNDLIASLYFFCDLIKTTKINKNLFYKIVKLIINILTDFTLQDEQKEILIKYYYEILKNFKIVTNDDINLVFTFYLKIHYDKITNFINCAIMSIIIANTSKEIMNKNVDAFIQMFNLISDELDEFKLIEVMRGVKKVYKNVKSLTGSNNSQREMKDFINKFVKKCEKEIKASDILKRKKEKLINLIK